MDRRLGITAADGSSGRGRGNGSGVVMGRRIELGLRDTAASASEMRAGLSSIAAAASKPAKEKEKNN